MITSPQKDGKPKTDRVFELDPARVKPFADQPRKRFRGIKKLAESIRAVGQVTPIIVTSSDDPDHDAELVDGERRLRACLVGKMRVRAVFETPDGEDRYVRSIAANFCRQGHDPVEIMDAVWRLKRAGKSRSEIAAIFGKTKTWVQQYLSLARLAPELLAELKLPDDSERRTRTEQRRRGRLSLSVALLLAPLTHVQQVTVLSKIKKARMSMAQARTFVRRFAAGRGVRLGRRQSDYSKFKALRSAVENCSYVAERYLDMPGVQIGPMIRSASRSEKKGLVLVLEKLCEKLLLLSDTLGKDE